MSIPDNLKPSETISKKKMKKDCFGFYDDGNKECSECKDSDECFKKGVL